LKLISCGTTPMQDLALRLLAVEVVPKTFTLPAVLLTSEVMMPIVP
jgi:hypothetical protein